MSELVPYLGFAQAWSILIVIGPEIIAVHCVLLEVVKKNPCIFTLSIVVAFPLPHMSIHPSRSRLVGPISKPQSDRHVLRPRRSRGPIELHLRAPISVSRDVRRRPRSSTQY